MKNSDMPAMPFKKQKVSRTDTNYIFTAGLTKREHFAGTIYAGMLQHGSAADSQLAYIAERSVFAANALLAELEKDNQA